MAAVGAPVGVTTGLRPFNPFRDLAGVTALLSTVFGPELSLESASSARLVRWMQRYPRIGWVWLGFDAWFDGTMGGFVWLEGDRVVGNANIAPAGVSGLRWILSNVAVDERLRGRGIGRRLVEACVEHVWASGGDFIMLQVWERNEAALHLYRSLGFEPVGSVCRLKVGRGWSRRPSTQGARSGYSWRSLRHGDARYLSDIAATMLPGPARMVRPSPTTPFRAGLLERAAGLLSLSAPSHVASRRVLVRERAVAAGLAIVPVDEALARATVICSAGLPVEVATAVVAELSDFAASRGVGLIVDLPASLELLRTMLLSEGWELQDSLLQMTADRDSARRWDRPH